MGGTGSLVASLGLEVSIILVTFVTMTVVLMWSSYIARQITDPLIKLSLIATRISKGDLVNTRMDISSNDEIGELVEAFNKMVNTYRILDTLAKEGQHAIADRGNPNGPHISDQNDLQQTGVLVVQLEQRGRNDGREDHVARVKHLEEPVVDLGTGVPEQKHADDSGRGPNRCKWSVVLEF